MNRYRKTQIFRNDYPEYSEMFQRRGILYADQYSTTNLKYPTDAEISRFNVSSETWKLGDSMWKYASRYYDGRSDLWWVIAHFNKKPTDHHFSIGEVIHIPKPLEAVLRSYGLQ